MDAKKTAGPGENILKTLTKLNSRILSEFLSILFLFVFCFISCKNDLVPSPEVDKLSQAGNSSVNTEVAAPEGVTASNGLSRKINLTWKESVGAVRYVIYSADTAFSEFEKTAETKDKACEISLSENAGIRRFYRVSAVDYKGDESSMSEVVSGSTLAVPVITGIETESVNGESNATVRWWLSNCNSSTYENDVYFLVTCYNESLSTENTEQVNGTEREHTFNSLLPGVNYSFKVSVHNSANSSEFEESDVTDKESARRLIPNAPENVTAARGESASSVTLSWTLPDYTEVKNSDTYEKHPLYFTVERKRHDETETEYKTVLSYVGTVKSMADSIKSDESMKIVFDSNVTGLVQDTDFTVLETGSAENVNSTYSSYIPGTKVYWNDTSDLERGVQYDYRITSYTDDVKTPVSSDYSLAESTGWTLSKGSFSASAQSVLNENIEGTIDAWNVTFDFKIENNEIDYNYILVSEKTPLETENTSGTEGTPTEVTSAESQVESTIIEVYESPDSVNSASYRIDLTGENASANEGYYRFKIYICASGTNDYAGSYIDVVEMLGSITAVNSESKLPKINYFGVEDGYADRFYIYFDYNENYSYTLFWDENGIEDSLQLTSDDFVTDTNTLPSPGGVDASLVKWFCHKTENVSTRTYWLSADTGVSIESEKIENKKTLGTPNLICDEWNYDSLVIKWNEVQCASETYTVNAYYTDDESKAPVFTVDSSSSAGTEQTEGETAENTDTTENSNSSCTVQKDESGNFVCTIKNPDGYNDYLRSGKSITVEVTANSSTRAGESNSAKIETNTLGPAATNISFDEKGISDSTIKVGWKKAKGAEGYIIRRVLKQESLLGEADIEHTYYYDGTSLTSNGEPVDASVAEVEVIGDVYTLFDYHAEIMEENATQLGSMQRRIAWGMPVEYVVLPVKSENDFSFTSGFILNENSSVNYCADGSALKGVDGYTNGYGLLVDSAKAESAKTQRIEWKKPNNSTGIPAVYRRISGGSGEWEAVAANTTSSSISAAYNPSGDDVFESYEYAVKYGTGDFAESYEEYLAAKKETSYDYGEGTPEPLNKGYLLAVKFTADYGGTPSTETDGGYLRDSEYYSERIVIEPWDYSKRAIGPDSYMLSVKNADFNGGTFTPLVDWTATKTETLGLAYKGTAALSDSDVIVKGEDGRTVKVYPGADSNFAAPDSATDGVLKVESDYRHYYRISLTRNINGTSVTVTLDDNTIYAARQITPKEFAILAAKTIGDSLKSAKDKEVCNPSAGIYAEYTTSAEFSSATRMFKFANEGPYMFNISNNLYANMSAAVWVVGDLKNYYTNDPLVLTFKHASDAQDLAYSGTVSINSLTASGGSFTVELNGESCSTNFQTSASGYFPF